jgi:hypothetical protein
MSDAIPDYPAYNEPPDYRAGLDFDYNVWPKNTEVTLTNVPWDAGYKSVWRTSTALLNNYIDSKGTANVKLTDLSWVKPGYPIKLPMSVNFAQRFNYVRVKNPIQPSSGDYADLVKYYYYFITSTDWNSPGATTITVQLDVFATFQNEVTWGNCYVMQGHAGIANELQMQNNGRDYLTVPEGRDIGGEYQVVERKTRNVMSQTVSDPDYPNPELDGYAVLLATTVSIQDPPKDDKGPNIVAASGDFIQGLPSGAQYYVFRNEAKFLDFMYAYSKYPWITEGVVSITAIPKPERYGYELQAVDMSWSDDADISRLEIFRWKSLFGNGKTWSLWPGWRDAADLLRHIPANMRHLKKFLTYPYMAIELTTWTGTPVILKPEMWNDPDARINEKAAIVPPNQRVVFMPMSYNARAGAEIDGSFNSGNGETTWYDDGGDYLDIQTMIANFPSFALVNNGTISFLAGNTHGFQYQAASADWSQQRAGASSTTALNQANKGISSTEQAGDIGRQSDRMATNIGVQAAWNQAGLGALSSVGNGMMGGTVGSLAGGATSAATGLMSTGISNNAADLQQANRNQTSVNTQNVVTDQMAYNRDSNQYLASLTQRGDYANAIAGINAKVQDARLIQPSSSGQTGGEAFGIIHGASAVSLRWKLIDNAAIRAIGNYWLRYGYQVMQFSRLPQSLMVMDRFTYWKLTETFLTGNIPELFKQALRGIMEQGTTVYANPDDIGNIDIADNRPLPGVRL